MPRFEVVVTIENRKGLSDPEGKTILKDLILKNSDEGSRVSEIRTAKMLRLTIDAADPKSAIHDVRSMCDGLRLYNPIVSTADIAVVENATGK